MWLFCVILSFFYFLIIVHLGESQSFLRITHIMTSIPPFAKWKKTGTLKLNLLEYFKQGATIDKCIQDFIQLFAYKL